MSVGHCCLPGRLLNVNHSLKTGLSVIICVTYQVTSGLVSTYSLWQVVKFFRSCLGESAVFAHEENRDEDHHVLGTVTPHSCLTLGPAPGHYSSPQKAVAMGQGLKGMRHSPCMFLGCKHGTCAKPVAAPLFSPATTFPISECCYDGFLFIYLFICVFIYLLSQLKILWHENWNGSVTDMNHLPPGLE